jgi:hypothetical protein
MPDSPKSAESKPTEQSLQEEVTRLRAQVKDLQEELTHRDPATESPGTPKDSSEILRDLPDRFMGEASKTVRDLILACLEPLRMAGDIVDAFAEETSAHNRPEERGTERGRFRSRTGRQSRSEAMNLSRDIYSGFIKAVDRSLDIPSKMVDRYHSTYKEAETTKSR